MNGRAAGEVAFWKMSGSGNDFVMLDSRTTEPSQWTSEQIRAICHRRHGVGADGFVILEPLADGRAQMHFYNADGGRAQMCGNAALCSTRLAVALGFTKPQGMQLVTDAGAIETRCVGSGSMAEIGIGAAAVPRAIHDVALRAGEQAMALGAVGVPHLVVLVDDVESADVTGRGSALRHHPAFGPEGANANFVSAPRQAGSPWRIRTFERGVEAETLACGTGTVAASLAVAGWGRAHLPMDWVSWGGGSLVVSGKVEGERTQDLRLAGEGRVVFTGTYPRPLER